MTDLQAGRVIVRFEGKDYGLTDLVTRLEQKMNQGIATTKKYSVEIEDASRREQRAAREKIAVAKAALEYNKAIGKTSEGLRIFSSTLAQLPPKLIVTQQAVARLQTEFAKLEKEELRASQSQSSMFSNISGGLNKFIGLGFAIQTVSNTIGEFINQANQAEKINTTFRALSGSTEEYQKNLAAAKNQQSLFGGSLAENQEDMSQLIYTARSAGIELGKLTQIARRLAIVDPVQGFKGASIALKEFFSGENHIAAVKPD
jgi:hypothetical protein